MSISLSMLALISGAAFAQEPGSDPAPAATTAVAPSTTEAAQMENTYHPSSAELGRAMRPLTYPSNPGLSQGKITNFYSLYVDPAAMPTTLEPRPTERPAAFQRPAEGAGTAAGAEAAAGAGTAAGAGAAAGAEGMAQPPAPVTSSASSTLPIANRTTGWLEVSVGGTKIGVLGPLTTGAIHGVKAGEYDVSFTSSTGYTERTRVTTTDAAPEVLVPGNVSAAVASDDSYAPPGYGAFQPTQVPTVRGYILPTPPASSAAGAPPAPPAGEKAPR